jgi:hypothetical protein
MKNYSEMSNPDITYHKIVVCTLSLRNMISVYSNNTKRHITYHKVNRASPYATNVGVTLEDIHNSKEPKESAEIIRYVDIFIIVLDMG